MPYSQTYPQYQDPLYDAQGLRQQQQQPWDGVDFATITPSGNSYQSLKDTTFVDINALPTDDQNAPSPNYSQFLNFDSSGVDSYSVPSEDIASDAFYNTSPASFVDSRQSTVYPLKIEPDLIQNNPLACAGQLAECSTQKCGPEPACLQFFNSPDIEECNNGLYFNGSENTNIDPNSLERTVRTNSGSADLPRKPKSEPDKKPRAKRGRKGSSSEDESAQLKAKQAHSIVERRYRDNLNGKIMQLHRALSATGPPARHSGMPPQEFYVSGQETRAKVRKSDVMTDAMNYVHQSEVSMRHMSDEIGRLTDRVRTLEKLVKCEDCTLLKQMVRLQLQSQQPVPQ